MAALTVAILASQADAAGPYPIAEIARAEFALPPTVLTPNTENFECLARTDEPTPLGFTPARVMCYNATAPAEPVPPAVYAPADHLPFNAFVQQDGEFGAVIITCLYFPELATPTALRITMHAQLDKAGSPVSGTVNVLQNTGPDVEFFYCADGTETTGPLTLTPLDEEVPPSDTDGDGCSDYDELGDNEFNGGLRDPFNPYDIFDASGDNYVDLPNDILGVILRWSGNPAQPYDVAFDRGLVLGPNHWNRDEPDGGIDLPNDILGAILQWTHDCR